MIAVGTKIPAPSGIGGYEVVEDIYPTSMRSHHYFKGYGGVPDPKTTDVMPRWLAAYIEKHL